MQTLCTLAGIVLISAWYLIEQPDSARLTFDHTALAAPAAGQQALVVVELRIENVGGRIAEFEETPYSILIQRIAPLDPQIMAAESVLTPTGYRRLHDANNWTLKDSVGHLPGLLAYRIGGAPPKGWEATDKGLVGVIAPKEVERYYFRAVVQCSSELQVSISSRVRIQPSMLDRLKGRSDFVWLKQSFLDLREACSPQKKE